MALTTEEIAGRLAFFHEQIHMIHWETRSFAEHKATGGFYEFLQDFKDEVIEKIMGYTGKRIQSLKIEAISAKADSMKIVEDVLKFSKDLENYGDTNKFGDICNMAQALSGEAAKMKYLLTLS
jgi:DNA-binding ferritin-like protein